MPEKQWVKISVETTADGALWVTARFRGEVVSGVCSCGDERCAFDLALDATCAVICAAYPGPAPDVLVGAKWGKRVLLPALPLRCVQPDASMETCGHETGAPVVAVH